MGPEGADLAKNNVASSKVLIFEAVQGSFPALGMQLMKEFDLLESKRHVPRLPDEDGVL